MLAQPHTAETDNQTTAGPDSEGIRAVLADTNPIYRLGMKRIFAIEDDIRVMADVETLAHLYAALDLYPADVVVIEEKLLAESSDVIPQILSRSPNTKLIVQVKVKSKPTTVELYRQGVHGIILRSIAADLLVKCVRKISGGEPWIDNEAVGWVLGAYRSQKTDSTKNGKPPKLSTEQLAIIDCVVTGMRNKEIADRFGTTEQGVKNWLRKIYGLCGVSDRLELALFSLHKGLLEKDLDDPKSIDPRHHRPGSRGAKKIPLDRVAI